MENSIAAELEDGDFSEMEGKYLTFWTDRQLFAVPIADVVQIVQVQPITPIPEFPSYVKGIINLRGSIIPVIDVRLRFGKEEVQYDEHTCIIVTKMGERHTGFIVDSVDEVTNISQDQISAPPHMTSQDPSGAYLTGIGKLADRVILLMNTNKILGHEQLEFIDACESDGGL